MSFREDVKKIQCKAICGEGYVFPDRNGACECLENGGLCDEARLAVDAICAKVEKLADGLPDVDYAEFVDGKTNFERMKEAHQTYIKEQCR